VIFVVSGLILAELNKRWLSVVERDLRNVVICHLSC
jgi:hypothetical protein